MLHRLQEVGVVPGQLLLGGYRHYLPVGLIDIHYGLRVFGVVLALGELLCEPGYPVRCDDLASREYGLLQRDSGKDYVVQVGMQQVIYAGAYAVDRLGYVGLREGPEHGLPHGALHIFHGKCGIAHDRSGEFLHLCGKASLNCCAGIPQRGGLVAVDQRNIQGVVKISAGGGNVREVVGSGYVPVIVSHSGTDACLLEGLVVGYGHSSAFFQAEPFLPVCTRRDGEGCCGHNDSCDSHV